MREYMQKFYACRLIVIKLLQAWPSVIARAAVPSGHLAAN